MTLEQARAESARIAGLLRGETEALGSTLVALAGFDRERGYEVLGHATLWTYLRDELRLTKNQTAVRFHATRMIREYPIAETYLRDGRLNMSTFLALKNALTHENARDLFDQTSWKSEDEAEEIAKRSVPKPAHVPMAVVRRDSPCDVGGKTEPESTPVAEDPTVAPVLVLRPPPAKVEAEWNDGYSVRLRFDGAFRAKYEKAKALLSHTISDGDPVKVFERGLDLILEKEAKKGTGPKRKTNGRRHIPAWMVKAVHERGGDCCVWVLENGKRCGSTYQTQVDHIVAVALGGKTELENLRLLCAAHNQLHARQTFGHDFMRKKISARR